ncbi:MAG TPA: hypothetical protein VMJ90_09445 [Anaerolineales bacterium]|nr:hypothetical protein [Anaerolineales bacterium]
MKKIVAMLGLILILGLGNGLLTAAAPVPVTEFTLVSGLPSTMTVGETFTVVVQVESDVPFSSVHANPSFQFPGKGVVAVKGGDRARSGTFATLEITYKAKSDTSRMPDGYAPVYFVVGVRYGGGYVVVQEYVFNVTVP